MTHPDMPEKCLQKEELLYGAEAGRERYEYVCCDNSRWAEHATFQNEVDFFPKLEAQGLGQSEEKPVIFYDPHCGIPLFKAPVGRSYEEWKDESLKHGWPSFRDEEMFAENIVEHGHGEVLSTCGLHLGHNIPDKSGNRYCINLICMAGHEGLKGPSGPDPPASGQGSSSTMQASSSGNGVSGSAATASSSSNSSAVATDPAASGDGETSSSAPASRPNRVLGATTKLGALFGASMLGYSWTAS